MVYLATLRYAQILLRYASGQLGQTWKLETKEDGKQMNTAKRIVMWGQI